MQDTRTKTKELILPSPGDPNATKQVCTESSVVIVGANGSGKTRLGSWIEFLSPQASRVHRLGAQKSLMMPDYSSTSSLEAAESMLFLGSYNPNHHANKRGHRWQGKPNTVLLTDYEHLLVYLFSDEYETSFRYRQESVNSPDRVHPPETRLDRIKRIWEKVLPQRELMISAGKVEARLRGEGTSSYPGSEMSDGERVIFYLIGQCLAAPSEHIIIVDEPELHLHRSLQASLWSAIESERSDCLFVYLTHDLDFAATRSGATKIWLKSYDGNAWEWHFIPPDNDSIPERILLEILGSRKPVLFSEGEKENLDYLLFSHVYGDFAVVPCGSCGDVIHATTTFSRMKSLHDLECRGIIDRDYRTDEEVEHIRKMGVYALDVSEIENVLLTEPVLRVVAENLLLDPTSIVLRAREIVFRRLKDEKDRLALRMARALLESKLGKFDTKAQERSALEPLTKPRFVLSFDAI